MTKRVRPLIGWAAYDAGLSAFNTLVMTFIFAVYATHTLAPDVASGTAAWGGMLASAGIAVLLLAPVAGAASRRWPTVTLGSLTLICIAGTGLLFIAAPGARIGLAPLTYALICTGVATVAYELTFIPYSARLATLAQPGTLARWSGYGWAAGYFGGLVVLGLALWLLVGDGAVLKPWLGTQDFLNVRACALLAVVWMLSFCMPLLCQRAADRAVPETNTGFLEAWRRCAAQPGLLRFIIASALYRDGLATVFGFGGIYAASVHGFALSDVLVFGIALNLGSGVGAAAFAWLDRYLAPLTVIRISLAGLTLSGLLVLMAPTVPLFWTAGMLLSLWFGPAQAAGRAYLMLEAGIERTTAALSLYTVTGRAANFIGPALYGAAVALTGLQQVGMGTVLIMFLAAASLLPRKALPPAASAPMTQP